MIEVGQTFCLNLINIKNWKDTLYTMTFANNLKEITQQEVLAQVNDSIVDLLRSHAKTILT
jgi:hypothetical protein